jgi:hypothetical protein
MFVFTRDDLKQILDEAANEVCGDASDLSLEDLFYAFGRGEANDPELVAEIIANAAMKVTSRLTSRTVFCFWQLITPETTPILAGDMYLILYDENGKLLTFQPPEPGVALFVESLDSVIEALDEITKIVASNIQRGREQ